MTQEELNILNIDLCARLPYGVKIKYLPDDRLDGIVLPYLLNGLTVLQKGVISRRAHIKNIRPYLRPMSSMTEEELKELNDKYGNIAYFFIQEPPYYYGLQAQHSDIGSIEISGFSEIYDWLNTHHFDYRGLIEKELALEAPEDMYKND